jgi:Kef-type K+ transport system membrane component KefB
MRRFLPLVAALVVIVACVVVAWLANRLDLQPVWLADIARGLILIFGIAWVIRLMQHRDQDEIN